MNDLFLIVLTYDLCAFILIMTLLGFGYRVLHFTCNIIILDGYVARFQSQETICWLSWAIDVTLLY